MDLLQRILLTAFGAASIVYIIIKISLLHWKNRGILHDKPKFWWGNLKGVGSKHHVATTLRALYAKYKETAPFVGFYAYLKPMVLILDLNAVQHILHTDAKQFIERGLYSNEAAEPLTANLMQLDGMQWQELRKCLHNAFHEDKLNFVLPALLEVSTTFKRSFAQKQLLHAIFNINLLMDSFNVDVIARLAFGLKGDSLQLPDTEFRQMTHSYKRNLSFFKTCFAMSYPNLARLFNYKNYDRVASQYFLKLIDGKINERCSTDISRRLRHNDFLDLFLNADEDHMHSKMSSQQVAAQAFCFVQHGLDACNNTLSFCLYELALQPDIQKLARLEIEMVMRNHQNQLSIACIRDMRYLRQILYETLRKHSPYCFLLRIAAAEYELPNTVFMLTEGNHIIVPIQAIHNDPSIYAMPEKFDPARFEESAMRERHAMSFIPFGVGPRSCIAMQFAELQMLLCLINLLQDYEFSPCAETSIPLQYDNTKLVLSPATDIKLLVERIATNT